MNEALRLPLLLAVAGALSTLGGCASPSPHYYADAGHGVATYAEVSAVQRPQALHLELRVLRAGKEDPDAARTARDDVLRVLDRIGGFAIADDAQADTLSIVISGDYDPHSRTGGRVLAHDLLLGLWLTHPVVDPLNFQFTYRPGNGAQRMARYDHAVISTFADQPPAPDDRGPFTSVDAAFNATIEDVTLHFLKELEGSTQNPAPLVYLP